MHTEVELPCVILIDNLQDFIDCEKFEQVKRFLQNIPKFKNDGNSVSVNSFF